MTRVLRRMRRLLRDALARAQRRIGREASGAVGRKASFAAPLTVTLAATAADLDAAARTIDSILAGSMAPRRVVLWLSADAPAGEAIAREAVEIRRADTVAPADVLLGAAREGDGRGEAIVVAHARVAYPRNWLERLYRENLVYPRAIVAMRCRQADPGQPYAGWPEYAGVDNRLDLVPLGGWGVLYPRHWLARLATAPLPAPNESAPVAAAADVHVRTLSLEAGVPVRCVGDKRDYGSAAEHRSMTEPASVPAAVRDRFVAALRASEPSA